MVTLIDGKAIADQYLTEASLKVTQLANRFGRVPVLATVVVGDDPASQVYVSHKIKACQRVGIESQHNALPANTTEVDLLMLIAKLNQDPKVTGILVQLPLPRHINAERVLRHIDTLKDVDGFHPVNAGRLFVGEPSLVPCTPLGVMKLIGSLNCDLSGRDAVVLGRSHIVGKPMAMLLLQKNATVTIAHSQTQNLPDKLSRADVVVAAIGKAGFVKGEWLKLNSVVIDVGINRDAQGKLCGDVDFASAKERVGAITPVPGGVGPMTIAMLMHNALQAMQYQMT